MKEEFLKTFMNTHLYYYIPQTELFIEYVDNHYKIKGNIFLLAGLTLGGILSVLVVRSSVNLSNEISEEIKEKAK